MNDQVKEVEKEEPKKMITGELFKSIIDNLEKNAVTAYGISTGVEKFLKGVHQEVITAKQCGAIEEDRLINLTILSSTHLVGLMALAEFLGDFTDQNLETANPFDALIMRLSRIREREEGAREVKSEVAEIPVFSTDKPEELKKFLDENKDKEEKTAPYEHGC